MGYGRDRPFLRGVGQRLVGLASDIPEPAGRAAEPSPLDAGRLRTSGKLVEQWRSKGAWEMIRNAIFSVDDTNMGNEEPGRGPRLGARPLPYTKHAPDPYRVGVGLAPALVAIFADLGPARADILICNVV